jgi:hypothetical protein
VKRLIAVGMLVACGGTSSPPAKSADAPLPPPKATRESKSGVLFVVAYEALLPIGCYDAVRKKWASGEACLDMLPEDVSVELESGKTVKAKGFRVPAPTNCTLTTPLLNFEEGAQEKAGTWGMWPPSSGARVQRMHWDATKGAGDPFPEEDRKRLGKALVASDIKVVQTSSADLDGDGTSEILYSVTALGFDPTARKGISGLYLSDRRAADAVPIRSSDHAVFRVEATVDVDDDGLKEVWISERTFHPNGLRTDTMVLAHYTPGGLTPLPPQESCWPPAKIK